MAINLRPGCKGVIFAGFAGLIPVGASWGQPVEPAVLVNLIARRHGGGAAVVGDGLRLRASFRARASLYLADRSRPKFDLDQ